MPPKLTKQKQSQAGKFKPLKRPAKKAGAGGAASSSEAPAAPAAAPSAAASSSGGRGKATSPDRRRGRGRDTAAGAAGASTRGGGGGRGRSRSPKGRGGSGRGSRTGGRGGRGRGRGGRFVVPAGAAFFTGEAAKRSSDTNLGGGRGAAPPPDAGTDGAVVLPGARAASASGSSGSGGGGGGGRASRASAAAASRAAREGEGEEIVVAEWMDVDVDDATGGEETKKRSSVLDGPSRSARTSRRFDDDDDVQEKEASVEWHEAGPSDAFVYDSDSSVEEERRTRRHARGGSGGGFGMSPAQLPFPAAHGRPAMYACQDVPAGGEEKKMSEGEALLASATMTASAKLRDPPVQSPFVDVDAASDEEQRRETEAWFVMKFPTRLPPLDAASTMTASGQSSKRTASLVKSELGDDGPDVVGSTHVDAGEGTGHPSSSAPSRPRGYDDTLKDAAPGRYGRIVVRQSGRTELVLGGGGGEEGPPEVRLLVHEGLRCGFRQEAVCIDPEKAAFVMLGDVDRSLVMTPDVERAFAFS